VRAGDAPAAHAAEPDIVQQPRIKLGKLAHLPPVFGPVCEPPEDPDRQRDEARPGSSQESLAEVCPMGNGWHPCFVLLCGLCSGPGRIAGPVTGKLGPNRRGRLQGSCRNPAGRSDLRGGCIQL